MAKITAQFDFFSPLWESEESVEVFKNGTDEEKKDWMLANCKCDEPQEIDKDDIYSDEVLADNEKYTIVYYDYGFIEGVRLIEF